MRPFEGTDTYSGFKGVVDTIIREIESLENEYVLKASATELETYFVDKVIIDPLVLHSADKVIQDQRGVQIDVTDDSDASAHALRYPFCPRDSNRPRDPF